MPRKTHDAGMLRTSTMVRLSPARPSSFAPTGSRWRSELPGW